MASDMIRWKKATEDTYAALVKGKQIGAVYTLDTSENWYGWENESGRIGTCYSLKAAKRAVEKRYHERKNTPTV